MNKVNLMGGLTIDLLGSESIQSVGEEIGGLRKEMRIINRILRDDDNRRPEKLRVKDINMKKGIKEVKKHGRIEYNIRYV